MGDSSQEALQRTLMPGSSAPQAASWGVLLPPLAFWFVSSTLFNDLTPRFLAGFKAGGGESVDVTLLELIITVCIAVAAQVAGGKRLLPPRALASEVGLACALHLLGCRLFITSIDFIPVSLAQTIRAANPLFVVAIGYVGLGERYSWQVVLSLLVIVLG